MVRSSCMIETILSKSLIKNFELTHKLRMKKAFLLSSITNCFILFLSFNVTGFPLIGLNTLKMKEKLELWDGEGKEMWLILSYKIKWCMLACSRFVFLFGYNTWHNTLTRCNIIILDDNLLSVLRSSELYVAHIR